MIDLNIKELNPPYFIHSDILLVRNIFNKNIQKLKNIVEYLELNKNLIYELFADDFIFPSFNYDFGKTKIFDMDNDISQVGALSEYIRKDRKIIRSAVPFFSILSTKEFIKREEKVYPFGPKSIFDILYKKKGTIIHYGCNFKDGLTFIHYIEQMNKAPVYRYEKVFNGEIKSQQKYYKCKIEMHVRPMNLYIDYDWEKIISELSAQNLIITSKKNSNIRALKSEKIANYISEKMLDDDLYLLKDSCKINIQKELDRLGRPFNILDFENEEA